MTLQPGQSLSAEDCKLLEAGDWLLVSKPAVGVPYAGTFKKVVWSGELPISVQVNTPGGGFAGYQWSRLTWLGRPGADGFIPWTGGENPAGEMRVDTRHQRGDECYDWCAAQWGVSWLCEDPEDGENIIAWRPAPSVEGGLLLGNTGELDRSRASLGDDLVPPSRVDGGNGADPVGKPDPIADAREVVLEWLAVAERVAEKADGLVSADLVILYPPICPSEIAAILKALPPQSTEEAGS